jgi:hypothetical protein
MLVCRLGLPKGAGYPAIGVRRAPVAVSAASESSIDVPRGKCVLAGGIARTRTCPGFGADIGEQ